MGKEERVGRGAAHYHDLYLPSACHPAALVYPELDGGATPRWGLIYPLAEKKREAM